MHAYLYTWKVSMLLKLCLYVDSLICNTVRPGLKLFDRLFLYQDTLVLSQFSLQVFSFPFDLYSFIYVTRADLDMDVALC